MEICVQTRLPPVDALLVADVGNTRIRIAIWDDDGLHDTLAVSTHDPHQWPPAIERLWAKSAGSARRAVVIGSVRPAEGRAFADVAARVCGLEPLFVGDDVPLPMTVEVQQPEEVGVDRVCAAAAAYDRVHASCAVASFGTAITIDYVSGDGRFLGGAILPGLQLSCDALHERTAKLPQVQPERPTNAFGRSTREAIVNGVAYGAVGALREIVERYATELREWPELIITGGNASLIAEFADFVDAQVADLSLIGISLAYRKAAAL